MRIIEPSQFRKPLKKRRPLRGLIVAIMIILLSGYGALAYAKPLPNIQAQVKVLSAPTVAAVQLQWPQDGQAAFGAVDNGVLAESGAQTTAPMASIAKVMTALAVLRVKPLKPGEPGPLITIGDADIQSYDHYVSEGGSVIAVNSGETISEYQALQALLLPSANNIADTLVRWAFGSTDTYVQQAGQLATALGLAQTKIADASGFSSLTKSTPHDLVILGIAALRNPVLAEIVQQKTATLPVAGEVENINDLLGQSGINGIKTGNTEEAGGCLLSSSDQTFSNGQHLTLVGAIMGGPTLAQAQRDALGLLRSAIPGFRVLPVVRRQTVVSTYKTSWGSSAEAVVAEDFNLLTWTAQMPRFKVSLDDLKVPATQGTVVGSLLIEVGSVHKSLPITLRQSLAAPTTYWRLGHLINN